MHDDGMSAERLRARSFGTRDPPNGYLLCALEDSRFHTTNQCECHVSSLRKPHRSCNSRRFGGSEMLLRRSTSISLVILR